MRPGLLRTSGEWQSGPSIGAAALTFSCWVASTLLSDQQSQCLQQIRSVMDRQVGVLRDEAGLQDAIGHLQCAHAQWQTRPMCRDAAMVSLMIAVSAYQPEREPGRSSAARPP